jgi:carboxyl-terminal processing protease
MRSVWWRVAGMSAVLAAFAGGMWLGERREQSRQPWARERLLSTALDSVRVNYLDSLPEGELMRRAVSGMLRELHDPYAALLESSGASSYRGTLRGESQGLGLLLRLRGQSVVVRRVVPGSPAALAGVRSGDVVVAVDGRRANEAWSSPRPAMAADSAGAPSPDVIQLDIVRFAARDTVSVGIVPSSWRASAVTDVSMVLPTVGFVTLASCSSGSAEALEQAVEELIDRGAKSLVLDLRGNMGGLYEEGVKAASLFLSRGDLVASLDRRGSSDRQEQSAKGTRWSNLPLVVLVDANTASSAELIAAALRDHGRALLVGDHTYGKGFVQRVVNINPELSLRLTTARWLSPAGTALQRREEKGGVVTGGLAPDIMVWPAARIDPSAVPASLSPVMARTLSESVDAVVVQAMLDGSSNSPLPLLERRLRDSLTSVLSRTELSAERREALLGDGTRVAMRRLLEMSRGEDALWQYAAVDDPAIRAAMDVLAPGRLTPADFENPRSVAGDRGAAQGDSLLLRRLEQWTLRRFAASEVVSPDSIAQARAAGRESPSSARIMGIVGNTTRDTVMAVHFGDFPFAPPHAAGRRVLLEDPSGNVTALEGQVLARVPVRAPVAPIRSFDRVVRWRHGWAYLVLLPEKSAAVHAGGFPGWRLGPPPRVASRSKARTAPRSREASAPVVRDSSR